MTTISLFIKAFGFFRRIFSEFQILTIFTKNLKTMSEHHHDHHDHHGHDDHGHHAVDRPYFDDSTSILAPIFIIIALIVVFGVLFFG